MKKLFKANCLAWLLLLATPLGLFAEGGDFESPPEIEPPPAASIDDYIIYFALLAIFVGFLFYKKNIKLEN